MMRLVRMMSLILSSSLMLFGSLASASNLTQFFNKPSTLKVYRSDGTTSIGYYLGLAATGTLDCSAVRYTDAAGNILNLSSYDCGGPFRDANTWVMYDDATCTSLYAYNDPSGSFGSSPTVKRQIYGVNSGNAVTVTGSYSCSSGGPVIKYYRVNGDSTCMPSANFYNWCPPSGSMVLTPVTIVPRACDGTSTQAASNAKCTVKP